MQEIPVLLQQSLIFFTYTTSVVLIILAIFFIKLLIELSNLTQVFQKIATIVDNELEPTLKELQTALKNVNAVATSADEKVEAIKNNVNAVITPLQSGFAKFKLNLLKGVAEGIKMFQKRR